MGCLNKPFVDFVSKTAREKVTSSPKYKFTELGTTNNDGLLPISMWASANIISALPNGETVS
jgi:DNA-binding HxlR family transcriptional regulator